MIVYPSLSNCDLGLFRIGGFGLANCLFVAARAFLLSQSRELPMLRPTWERFGFGQFLRHEKDKRLYAGLFRRQIGIDGIKKLYYLFLRKNQLVKVSGWEGHFKPILKDHDKVVKWLDSVIAPDAVQAVPDRLPNTIAVHIRLGDYPDVLRTPISWYVATIKSLLAHSQKEMSVLVFSDGSDSELSEVLAIPHSKRAFYGNAIADILAISRCSLLVGSDSTFSGWGAYIGQIPSIFYRVHYGTMLQDERNLCVTGEHGLIEASYYSRLKEMGVV